MNTPAGFDPNKKPAHVTDAEWDAYVMARGYTIYRNAQGAKFVARPGTTVTWSGSYPQMAGQFYTTTTTGFQHYGVGVGAGGLGQTISGSIGSHISAEPIDVPDRIEPVVGWRSWEVDDLGLLKSIHRPVVWRPRVELIAVCSNSNQYTIGTFDDPKPHAPPVPYCSCGVYAGNFDVAMHHGGNYSLRAFAPRTGTVKKGIVIGKVALWGKIVQHRNGWRAQYAYPQELWLYQPSRWLEVLYSKPHKRIANLYEVPCHRLWNPMDIDDLRNKALKEAA